VRSDCTLWDLEGGNGVGFDLRLKAISGYVHPRCGSIVIIDSDSLEGYAASTSGVLFHQTFVLAKVN
jgi:hypothetical protein